MGRDRRAVRGVRFLGPGRPGAARNERAAGAATSRPPNVILVITDDQGYGDLGVHGNDVIRTPNLDRLAEQSVRLTDFHVDPTCSPTRAALLTGRYSTRTGVWHTIMGRSLMAPGERTIAELFAEAGYRTGMVGKWHLGDNYPLRPHDQGFQEAFYHGGGVVGHVGDHFGNDLYDDTYFRNGVPEAVTGYATDVWFDEALSFIQRDRDRPFFLYLATNAAHWPYFVDEKYVQPYLDAGVPPTMARFYGMVTNIDENVGRLTARLRELGLEREHDPGLHDRQRIGGGLEQLAERAGRVEGLQRWHARWQGIRVRRRTPRSFLRALAGGGHHGRPRGRSSQRSHRRVAHAGRDVRRGSAGGTPARRRQPGPGAEGRVRAGATTVGRPRDAGSQADRVLFVHSQRVDVPVKWRRSSVMTERWRLVNGEQLFDIEADPGQKVDVAADHPDTVKDLRGFYDEWWASLEPVFDDVVRIGIGADAANPTALTSHDWRTDDDSQVVWNANQVNSAHPGNGYWAVDVMRAGVYEVELRRWPRPSRLGIDAQRARLKVGGVEAEKVTSPFDPDATFRVELDARTDDVAVLADRARGRGARCLLRLRAPPGVSEPLGEAAESLQAFEERRAAISGCRARLPREA